MTAGLGTSVAKDDRATVFAETWLGAFSASGDFDFKELLSDELSALQSEQDMPIEELLKLYGYNNAASGANKGEEEKAEQEESKEEEEEEEKVEIVEESSKETAQIVPEVEDEEIEAEPSINVQKGEKRSSSSPPPAKKARSELAKYGMIDQ